MSETKSEIDTRLEEIRQRAEKATPAPWTEDVVIDHEGVWPWYHEEDMQFAYHARLDIPWLLDQLQAERQTNSKSWDDLNDEQVKLKSENKVLREALETTTATVESSESAVDVLQNALETVRAGLYESMGAGHCINSEGRHVELWSKDPNFHGDQTGQKIQLLQSEVHKRLVEHAHLIDSALAALTDSKKPETEKK